MPGLLELAAAMVICLALALLGHGIARLFLVRVSLLDFMALAFPLGAGVYTFSLFLLSWAGIELSLGSMAVAWAVLVAVALVVQRSAGASESRRLDSSPVEDPPIPLSRQSLTGVLAGLVLLSACAAWLGVSQSYSGWDDMAIWGIKALGISHEGTIWAAGRWGDHGLAYPLNIPLLMATLRVTGDAMPASKVAFSAFYLSLLAACLRFWFRRRVPGWMAVPGVYLLAVTPIVFEHATLGYANLPYSLYLVMGCAEAVDGVLSGEARRLTLSGLLLSLAAWTRPEGTLAVAAILLVMLMAIKIARVRVRSLVSWLSPVILIAGTWQVFLRLYGSSWKIGQAIGAALESAAHLELHLGAFYWIARYAARQAIEPSVWGILAPVCVIGIAIGLRRLRPRVSPGPFMLAAALVAIAGGVTLQFYLADFLGGMLAYLGNSVNRMYMPAAIAALLLAIWILYDARAAREPNIDAEARSALTSLRMPPDTE